MPIQLIVGLRNPGSSYQYTRHNAGAWFVQSLVQHCSATFKADAKIQGELSQCQWHGVPLKAFLPLTFMNHSGRALKAICQFYKIPLDEVLVVHDDLDLEPGRIKLKTGGGHGGHNGLRDITTVMGTNQFHRLRIGIGHPGHKDLVTGFVLGKPTQHERQLIHDAMDRGLSTISILLERNMALAMTQLNT